MPSLWLLLMQDAIYEAGHLRTQRDRLAAMTSRSPQCCVSAGARMLLNA
jgi:hypothetical protein